MRRSANAVGAALIGLSLVALPVLAADAVPRASAQTSAAQSGAPQASGAQSTTPETISPQTDATQSSDAQTDARTPARHAGAVLSPELEARAQTIFAQLKCMICRGLSIKDSPADLAVEMRGEVRDQLAAGRTEDEIKAYFVNAYGESVLLAPPATGFNLVVYVLPPLAVLAGALFVYAIVRKWTRGAPAVADGVVEPELDAWEELERH